MSDAITLNPSKNDWFGSLVPRHTAKLISQGIEDNSLLLLPDKDGKIEIKPIYNANNGWILNAKDLVPGLILSLQYQTITKMDIEFDIVPRGLFGNIHHEFLRM